MTHEAIIFGLDLGKNWFHVVGINGQGKPVLRKKFNRTQLAEFAGTTARCIVAMESCPGSQHWGRRFAEHGHGVRIIPAQFVKPYLKPIRTISTTLKRSRRLPAGPPCASWR